MIVCLDAGHGGSDPGAVNANLGVAEKKLTLQIAGYVRDALNSRGVSVVLTRDCDIFVPLSARARTANCALADLFVSVHINAATNPDARGIETWHFAGSAASADFARTVQDEVKYAYHTIDRGVKASPGFYVLKHTRMPAVLVECGFISNDSDVTFLSNPAVRADIGYCIARGVLNFAESLKKKDT